MEKAQYDTQPILQPHEIFRSPVDDEQMAMLINIQEWVSHNGKQLPPTPEGNAQIGRRWIVGGNQYEVVLEPETRATSLARMSGDPPEDAYAEAVTFHIDDPDINQIMMATWRGSSSANLKFGTTDFENFVDTKNLDAALDYAHSHTATRTTNVLKDLQTAILETPELPQPKTRHSRLGKLARRRSH